MSKSFELIATLILLTVMSLLLFYGLGSTIIADPEEAVYAEVSREMYLASEAVVPTFDGAEFFEIPPLQYWTQMLGYRLFGINSLGARAINALCGLTTIMILFFSARIPLGGRTAFNSALILGSSVLVVYLSRVAMPDMLLTMFLVISVASFWHGVERTITDQDGSFLFWTSCLAGGFTMLSNGPFGVLVLMVTVVIYLLLVRRIGLLFRKNLLFPGALIIAIVGCSWYVVLGFIHPDGFELAKELFIKHLSDRFSDAMAVNSTPFYYYLIALLLGFFPWFSYLPLAAVNTAVLFGRDPASRFVRLFVIFSIVTLFFLPFTAFSLPLDLLPLFPGLALLSATLFSRDKMRFPTIWLSAGWLSAVLILVLAIALAASPLIIPYLPELLGESSRNVPILAEPVQLGAGVWIAALLFISSAVIIIRSTRSRDVHQVFQGLLLSSFIVSATIFFTIMPLYDRLISQPLAELATTAAEHTPTGGRIVLYNISDRPSVMFVSGRRTIYHSDALLQQLPELFNQEDISVGITTNYSYARLLNHSIAVDEIARQGGFVLFSMSENSSAETTSPLFSAPQLP